MRDRIKRHVKFLDGSYTATKGCSAAPILGETRLGRADRAITLFAILQLKLLQPPLNLGDRQLLLEQFAKGVPLALGELHAHTALPEPKREVRWPLSLARAMRKWLPFHERLADHPLSMARNSARLGHPATRQLNGLLEWRSQSLYNQPEDFVFASERLKGQAARSSRRVEKEDPARSRGLALPA
jgi:hypothetical protein